MKNVLKYCFVLIFALVSCSDESENQQQANSVPQPRNCESTSLLVGQSRELSVSNTYGISGSVTIVSDCEIEITNFFYDGSGPNVSVYAGIDGDFRGGVNMSEPINGTRFQGETLNLFLPEGSSFNEFNGISIWCFEFDISFSSASF
ncbi:DM13 domain-containing protein [Hyunsoonleella sp. 2307UL5-6]|uniref:DM13 domain-containing protein n=1 Tax=Hyunsoonleella sp. 2307UL5-6 TaxID=3384768 RepID=UPI0039BC5C5D